MNSYALYLERSWRSNT